MCKAHANNNCKSCCGFSPSSLRPRWSAADDNVFSPPCFRLPTCWSVVVIAHGARPSVGWKKQITKLHKEGKKADKGRKGSGSNF